MQGSSGTPTRSRVAPATHWARALYLFQNGKDTYFRIHGTTQPSSIGRSVSNGCIRMLNTHVKDLYQRVPIGTKVTVL
jgi:lipoprotein-anchoring transpeptidase ErfK/SrfK